MIFTCLKRNFLFCFIVTFGNCFVFASDSESEHFSENPSGDYCYVEEIVTKAEERGEAPVTVEIRRNIPKKATTVRSEYQLLRALEKSVAYFEKKEKTLKFEEKIKKQERISNNFKEYLSVLQSNIKRVIENNREDLYFLKERLSYQMSNIDTAFNLAIKLLSKSHKLKAQGCFNEVHTDIEKAFKPYLRDKENPALTKYLSDFINNFKSSWEKSLEEKLNSLQKKIHLSENQSLEEDIKSLQEELDLIRNAHS